jgi:hypothetical protein
VGSFSVPLPATSRKNVHINTSSKQEACCRFGWIHRRSRRAGLDARS